MNPILLLLAECLKYERTICACFGGYHAYFSIIRIHQIEEWMGWCRDAACKRVDALEKEIFRLGGMPVNEAYEFELVMLERAEDILDVWQYFDRMISEAIQVYARSSGVLGTSAPDSIGTATTGAICGAHQVFLEDTMVRVKAKQTKVKLIGAAQYIAEHMHT